MRNNIFNRPVEISHGSTFSSTGKASSYIITNIPKEEQSEEVRKVRDVVNNLVATGVSKMGEGYCISVSDILFNMLTHKGIKCHLFEVQLSIVNKTDGTSYMVGYNTTYTQNSHTQVQTHVVVITDTDIPMLIDLSIAHRLPNGMQALILKAETLGSKVIADFIYSDWGFIYQEKKHGIGIPHLHQISILDRIATDQKIFRTLEGLKRLNYLGIILSTFAALNVIGKLLIDWYN